MIAYVFAVKPLSRTFRGDTDSLSWILIILIRQMVLFSNYGEQRLYTIRFYKGGTRPSFVVRP